jgi:asparagine synthase (glutamine-hydrolysing)
MPRITASLHSGQIELGLLPHEPGFGAGPFTAGALTAVGEVTVHNGDELRRALAAAGDPAPAGCADGELLLRCYARLGSAGLRLADGMFVLAIADGRDLVLVRDHVGTRTMFYARTGTGWAAGTSLRALRRRPGLDTGLNLAAVRSFLTFAYLPGAETLLRGVSETLPGRCLRLSPDGTATEEPFWEPVEAIDESASPADHARELRRLLEQATARRLPPAQPVGILLSGGIDSSLVTALAAKLHDHPVHTYSISFGHDLPNELAYSGLVAAHCNTRHRILDVSGNAVAARLADTVSRLDSPVGDPLTVPNLLLAEAVAGDGLRVVLNGEGGDPVFGGPKNLPMLVYELHRGDPDPAARAAAYLRSYRKCLQDLPALLAPDVLAALETEPGPDRFVAPYLGGMTSVLNQLLHANLRTKGAHHILTKVERLTASCGLEGRAPLFAPTVVDHAFTVPPRLKLRGTVEKWVLKEAVRDLLPDTIVERPKSGMCVPVQQWLRGPLRTLTHDVFRDAGRRGLVNPATIRSWLRREGTLLPRHGGKLWLVLTLELWLRAYDI